MCSQRQAWRFLGLSRASARYRARPKADEADLVERLKEFASKRRRRGYRLAHRKLRREGILVNHKRVYRLWRRERLSVPARRTRKRIRNVTPRRAIEADRPNGVWCLDFVEDGTLSAGQVHDSDEATIGAVLDGVRVPRPGGKGRPRKRPDRVLGDKGYSYKKCRRLLRQRGIACMIPERKDQREQRKRKGRAGGCPCHFDKQQSQASERR